MKASLLIVFCICIYVVGCDLRKGRTPLEKTANEIQQGMSQEQISILFKDFHSSSISDFGGTLKSFNEPFHKGVAFKTNAFVGFQINYAPSNGGFFEICTIYFDTNKIIMGYDYILDQ